MNTPTAEQIEAFLRQSTGRMIEIDPMGGRSLSGIPAENRGGPAVTYTPEYRDNFRHWLRTGDDRELRSMQLTVDPQGGYLVPDTLHKSFAEALETRVPYRNYCTVIPTAQDTVIPIPNQDGACYWTNEQEDYTESDDTIAVKVLGAHKLTRLQKVSEELLQDSVFSIDELIGRLFARAYARAEELAFTTGNGIGRPTGWLTEAEVGVTAASATDIDSDELVDLYYSLDEEYAENGTWFMNRLTVCHIRKLKDGHGDYLWEKPIAAGQPPTLLGRPVVSCRSMPAIAAGAKVIGFGDFSHYWIADRVQVIMQRLTELYAEKGQVGFRMARRMDGHLTIPSAIKVLQMGAGGS